MITRARLWGARMAILNAIALAAIVAPNGSADTKTGLSASPANLSFAYNSGGAAPGMQTLSVTTASQNTSFAATASGTSGGHTWLHISPSGTMTGSRNISVSVDPTGMAAGTYTGSITLTIATSSYTTDRRTDRALADGTFRLRPRDGSGSTTTTTTVTVTLSISGNESSGLTVTPSSLSFSGTLNGSTPSPQTLSVTASMSTSFTVTAAVQGGSVNWLSVTPSGTLTTNRSLTVSVSMSGLVAGTYSGNISIVSGGTAHNVPVRFLVNPPSSGGGGTATGYKVIGWNDLGMHCFDGADYSIFGVLPPYNTIHAHVIDATGALVKLPSGYTVTYQAVTDPLTNTINTSSIGKTNFWEYAAALGFGALTPDVGLAGYAMPGAGNVPQAMTFSTTDNTWVALGIPTTPFADSSTGTYSRNYFPMMRISVKNSSGTVVAMTDVVTPTSDELSCGICHSSTAGYAATMPASGWANDPNPARDVKLNILRKHDDRFKTLPIFLTAAAANGYSASGLEATVATKPIFCDNCHASNALGKTGITGIPPLTTSMHSLHATAVEPSTGQTMDSGTTRNTCYSCHPGPNTQCLRGIMANQKTAAGTDAIECQSCHGNLSSVANPARKGWLDEPNCQSCHTGTATNNAGQIVYTSVFSSGTTVRTAPDATFATNVNMPAMGLSLYRYSSGHGGLQCEACHGSTHAEYETSVVNDNVQSTNLQGHAGALAECTACHASTPNTVTGGPHGLHPIGNSWVSTHQDVAQGNQATCQPCHGTDYRGTILSQTQADRSMAGKTFPRGTIIGCYSCHNGPNGD